MQKVLESNEYKELTKKSENRRSGAKKATETKRAKLKAEVDEKIKHINVKKLNLNAVQEYALTEKQGWYNYQGELRGYIEINDVYSADQKTKERWTVNYIRHNLTSYDDALFDMAGKVGCHEEYIRYKEAVMNKIAESYPDLERECKNQLVREYW